jgi:plastocyanin
MRVVPAIALMLLAAIMSGCGGSGGEGVKGVDSGIPGYSVTAVQHPGKVTGHVRLLGQAPAMPEFKIDDPACAQATANNRLDVGEQLGIVSAVVYIDGIAEGKAPRAIAQSELTIEQRGCQYTPHVVVAPLGSTVTFVNDDDVPHNVRVENAVTDSMMFNRAQPVRGRRDSMVVRQAGPASVGCDYHPWMNAYVFGVKSPYYALTDRSGRFEIDGIPPGTYTVRVWINGVGLVAKRDNQGKLIRYDFGAPIVQEHRITIAGNDSLDVSFQSDVKLGYDEIKPDAANGGGKK